MSKSLEKIFDDETVQPEVTDIIEETIDNSSEDTEVTDEEDDEDLFAELEETEDSADEIQEEEDENMAINKIKSSTLQSQNAMNTDSHNKDDQSLKESEHVANVGKKVKQRNIDMNRARLVNSNSVKSAFAMIAARKFVFSTDFLKHLDITEDQVGLSASKKTGVRLIFSIDEEAGELLIFREDDFEGRIISGSYLHPEVYAADVCKIILDILGVEMVASGTIRFPKYEKYYDENLGNYISVDFTKHSENPGVLKTKKN